MMLPKRFGRRTETRTPLARCSSCGRPINSQSNPHDEIPQPGDVTICIGCGHVMVIDGDGSVREMTLEEAVEITRDDVLQAEIKRIKRGLRNVGLSQGPQ